MNSRDLSSRTHTTVASVSKIVMNLTKTSNQFEFCNSQPLAHAFQILRDLHQLTPADELLRLNLVESLLLLREDTAALDEARRALALCEAWPGLGAFEGRRLVEPGPRDDETWAWLEQPFPPTPGVMTTEWRRIESAHANDPAALAEARRTLIRWRLHLVVTSGCDLAADRLRVHRAVPGRRQDRHPR